MSEMHAHIAHQIMSLREQRVMLDSDLAALYGVETKVLVQAVKRNMERFPVDFIFQLSPEEWKALRSQTVTSNSGRGGRRYPPYVFTEQGVAMLSSVLNDSLRELMTPPSSASTPPSAAKHPIGFLPPQN